MKCDTCRNKDNFDECKWPQIGSCMECPCNTCDICKLPVNVMKNIMAAKEE